jgi:hypothetical protein
MDPLERIDLESLLNRGFGQGLWAHDNGINGEAGAEDRINFDSGRSTTDGNRNQRQDLHL